jgi:hypothetical protein
MEKNIKLVLQTFIDNGLQVDCSKEFPNLNCDGSGSSANYSPDTIEEEVKSIRKQIIPSVPLSLVGLNREYKESWALKLVELMFYTPKTLY